MILALRGAFLRCLRITLPMRQCLFRSTRLAGRSLLPFSFGTTQHRCRRRQPPEPPEER